MKMWNDNYLQAPGLAFVQGRLRERTNKPKGFVIHHGGAGVIKRYKREKKKYNYTDAMDCHIRIYQDIMPYSGHYVVGDRAENGVVQIIPDELVAWHAGIAHKEKLQYQDFNWRFGALSRKRFKWWADRWPGLSGPQDFICRLAPNNHMIGIELVPTDETQFPEIQMINLAELLLDLSQKYDIPWRKERFLTHNDVNPLKRTTWRGQPYDPPVHFWPDLARILTLTTGK